MVAARVDRQPDDLHIAPVELRLDPGHVAQFGRADRGEVLRMREQDRPRIADPVVEMNATFSVSASKSGAVSPSASAINPSVAGLKGDRSGRANAPAYFCGA